MNLAGDRSDTHAPGRYTSEGMDFYGDMLVAVKQVDAVKGEGGVATEAAALRVRVSELEKELQERSASEALHMRKELQTEPMMGGGDTSQISGPPGEAEAQLRERVKQLERQLVASKRPDQIDLTGEVEMEVKPQGGGAPTGEGGGAASGMAVLVSQQSKLVKVKEEKVELEEEMHEEGKYRCSGVSESRVS